MGSATVEVLSRHDARCELDALQRRIGTLEDARERSRVGLLSDDDEAALRRAEELAWLLEG